MMRIRWKIPALLLLAGLFAAAPPVTRSHAASGPEISANVNATLNKFFRETPYGRDLANRALAVLVFPTIVKAGFGIGAGVIIFFAVIVYLVIWVLMRTEIRTATEQLLR